MIKNVLRETYALVNLDHLAENYQALRSYLPKSVALACVVKGDAYGHGLKEIVKTLYEEKADYFAVACLSEGLAIRKMLPDANILVMGNIPEQHLLHAIQANITVTIHSRGQGNILNKLAKSCHKTVKAHLKLDTGFNRLGFKSIPEALEEAIESMFFEHIVLEGVFSHLALKDYSSDDSQYIKLVQFSNQLMAKGIDSPIIHICDSIAAIDLPEYHLDMVRAGAILYGLKSHKNEDIKIKQILSLVSHITRIESVSSGENISYGDSYEAAEKSIIGTIAIGYGDGYPRNLSNRGFVKIKNCHYPIIGRICMDQCMVDLTGSPDIKVGDQVIIYDTDDDSKNHLSKLAPLAETNKNELLVRLTGRVPRIYIKNNAVYKIFDPVLEEAYE